MACYFSLSALFLVPVSQTHHQFCLISTLRMKTLGEAKRLWPRLEKHHNKTDPNKQRQMTHR